MSKQSNDNAADAVEISSGGRTVITTADALEDLAKRLGAGHPLSRRISGSFLKAVVKLFCAKESKDFSGHPVHSIGVGRTGLAATDMSSAISIGTLEREYEATDRREALLEAERSTLWGEGALFEPLTRTEADFPAVGRVLDSAPSGPGCVEVSVHPNILRKIGQLGDAAGAREVVLTIPKNDPNKIAFRFMYDPESQGDLFAVDVSPITVDGLFMVKDRRAAEDDE